MSAMPETALPDQTHRYPHVAVPQVRPAARLARRGLALEPMPLAELLAAD
jgi:hypothetical protein